MSSIFRFSDYNRNTDLTKIKLYASYVNLGHTHDAFQYINIPARLFDSTIRDSTRVLLINRSLTEIHTILYLFKVKSVKTNVNRVPLLLLPRKKLMCSNPQNFQKLSLASEIYEFVNANVWPNISTDVLANAPFPSICLPRR